MLFPLPFDPFQKLGDAAAKVVADGWTSMMLSIWNAGLFVMGMILKFEDHFLTVDLREDGPLGSVYSGTVWIALMLVVILTVVQIGAAVIKRDGKSLGQVVLGVGQFVMIWAVWVAYCGAVLAACGGLNKALMSSLFGVDTWDDWQPWEPFTGETVTQSVVATVLGLMGLLLWLAAIAHFLVILTRAGALLVIAATMPICAAGLVSDIGKSWFGKSLRWFHAAAFTPVVMTLVMGLGIKVSSGVAQGLGDSTHEAIGTALPAVLMIIVSAVSPLALFKMLAFMEPGTTSGAALRAGMAASGGLAGLLSGRSAGGAGGTAAESGTDGRSQGEAHGEAATAGRFAVSAAGAASALGPVGQAVGMGFQAFTNIGAAATSVGADATNQMGVGHNTYQPDFLGAGNATNDTSGQQGNNPSQPGNTPGPPDNNPGPRDNTPPIPDAPDAGGMPQLPNPGGSGDMAALPPGRGVGTAGGAAGAGAGGAVGGVGAAGGAEAAAVVVV